MSQDVHTNNIERIWATLKRSKYSIYHHVSIHYMQRYVDEFYFRYNNHEMDMFNMVYGKASPDKITERNKLFGINICESVDKIQVSVYTSISETPSP